MIRFHELDVVWVPIEAISQHPDNANNGDLDMIEQSVDVNGFFAPITVQRSTGFIIIGNHRYVIALKKYATQVPVIYLDVDDEEAKRIMLADNRTARLGQDDEAQLFELLDQLHDTDIGVAGTGFTTHDYTYLLDLARTPLELTEDGTPEAPEALGASAEYVVPKAPAAPSSMLGYRLSPTIAGDGKAYEVVLTRDANKPFTRHDMNRIRKSFGQNPLSDEEWDSFGLQKA